MTLQSIIIPTNPSTHHSNVFFFHASVEALFSSSFIRFESILLTCPKHSAINHRQMQQNTGLIESIILEVKDRNRIGGFHFNPKSNLICCEPFLSKNQNCNLGEVIIHDNPNFSKKVRTFFQGTNQIVHMDFQSVQINTTGETLMVIFLEKCKL